MRRLRTVLAVLGLAIAASSSGAIADNDGRYDPQPNTQHKHEGRLSPDTRRALRRFDEQKHRDYRRLGERHFDSQRERERAYQELRREHRREVRDILGESRFDEDDVPHHRGDEDRREHGTRGDHRNAAPTFDPAAVSASLASRWALSESDQDALADILEDYEDDAQELDEERFDSAHERREARRELEEDYRDELADIFDDVADADAGDILERIFQN